MIYIEADVKELKVILTVPNKLKPVYTATMTLNEAIEISDQLQDAVRKCLDHIGTPIGVPEKVFNPKQTENW